MVNKKKKVLTIKNPQRATLKRWIAIDIFLIILGLHSFFFFDINSADGLFILVSITVVITSLFFIKSTLRNIKLLDNAIFHRKMITHWKYTKTEWMNYLEFEERHRSEMGKTIGIFLSIITTIIWVPFILIISEGKLAMFFVLLGLYLLYFFMGSIFPNIVFYYKRKNVGEVILLEKGVLLNKEFHTWDFLLSKFCSAKHVKKPYDHLVISYDFWDRTGPKNYAINVPIPKSNKKDIKTILKKFK